MRVSSNSKLTDEQGKVFGAEMKRLRKEAGMTTGEFAFYIGVSQAYVSNLECGSRKPSPQLAERIAEVFDLTIDDMLKPYDAKVSEERIAFGKKLARARADKGYSVSLVAGALGIPTAVYKEYEQGACSITEREVKVLNKLLGLVEEPAPTEAEEVVEAVEETVDVPTEICDIIMEHIADLKVDKDTQKKIWRYFVNMKLDAEERRLFG